MFNQYIFQEKCLLIELLFSQLVWLIFMDILISFLRLSTMKMKYFDIKTVSVIRVGSFFFPFDFLFFFSFILLWLPSPYS